MSRYQLTPARRRSILTAQRRSAQKRKKVGFVGKLLAQGVRQTVNTATMGGSGKIQAVLDPNSQRNVRRNAKLRRQKAYKLARYG